MSPVRLRLVAAAAALAVAGPLGLLAALGAPPTPTRCADASAVTRAGDWEAVRGPSFTVRPGGRGQAITAFAVHPTEPRTRYATNGTSVERSDDGGCTWREVYALPDVPSEEDTLAASTAEVLELVAPTDPRGADRLLLLVRDGNGGPRVLLSPDGGGQPFRDRSAGLPPVGTPRDLMIAPTNPDFFFLAVEAVPQETPGPAPLPLPTLPPLPGLPGSPGPTSAAAGALYASVDGGLAWEARVDAADLGTSSAGIDLLVGHPTSPNRIWAVADGIVRASTDGGRTFRGEAPTPAQQRERSWRITALGVDVLSASAGAGAGLLQVVAFSETSAQDGGPIALLSNDGGRTFDEQRAPGVFDAVTTFLPGSGSFVGSTRAQDGVRAGVHLLNVRAGRLTSLRDLAPPTTALTLAATTDRSESPTLYARTPSALLRYTGPEVEPPPDLPPVVGGAVSDELAALGEATLTPARDEVQLEVGESRTLPHVLVPPRRLRPLDLYVVVDTSISMADDLDRVEADLLALVDRLRARGLDLSVGLGELKGGESTLAYRRVTGVGPSTAALRAGLDSLVADGYGLEAQLIAMEQALDGAGEGPQDLLPAPCKLTPDNPDRFVQQERRTAPPVLPGQQADFRRGSVPVVLMVTDTNFLRPAGTRLKPDCTVDVETVAQRYAAAGVHAVGLGVDDVDNPQRAADLLTFARVTGALQPGPPCAPGIDAGSRAPAVCTRAVDLVATLEALAARQSEVVDLDVVETSEVMSVRAPAAVDLRRPMPVALPVTYSCAEREPGTYAADLQVRLREQTVARLTASVTCVARPQPVVPPAAPVAAAVLALPLLPPGGPPPPPPAQGTQVQTQTQPQSQVQSQVQAGLQEREEAAAALAVAHQQAAREEGLETAPMTGRRAPVPVPVWLGALTALTAVAGSVAVARQRAATQPVAIRVATRR